MAKDSLWLSYKVITRCWSNTLNIQLKYKTTGFTLIEMLIVIALMGILGAIAYPAYNGLIEKARREEAKRTLVEASQMLEGYYTMNMNYTGSVAAGEVKDAVYKVNTDFSEYYTLTAAASASTFTLSATPTGSQTGDDCGTLTISQTGKTTPSSTGCW